MHKTFWYGNISRKLRADPAKQQCLWIKQNTRIWIVISLCVTYLCKVKAEPLLPNLFTSSQLDPKQLW